MFILVLIVGFVLIVDRKIFIKFISGYIFLIIIGVFGVLVGGVFVGLVFGKSLIDVMMNYVFSIMGGGIGVGVVFMFEIWFFKIGRFVVEWFGFVIFILSIVNVFVILCGVLFKKFGEMKFSLIGNGELIIDNLKEVIRDKEIDVKFEFIDIIVVFILIGVLFMVVYILGEFWFKFLIEFELYCLVFLIFLIMFLNIVNLVFDNIKVGVKRM